MITIRQLAKLMAIASVLGLPACAAVNRLTGSNAGAGSTASQTPAPPAQTAVASGLVQQVQLVLQQQGTYTGAVDGVWGPATQTAVKSYQQAHNIGSSGQIDAATLASLNIAGKPATSASSTETPTTQMSDGSKMSEVDARKMIEAQGFTHVVGLYRDDSAVWRGVATKGDKTGEVALDAQGHVVTN